MKKLNKKVVSGLSIWTFINVICLIVGVTARDEEFWEYHINPVYGIFPFDDYYGFRAYDFSEFFFYVGFPILIYWLYRYNSSNSKQ